LFSLVAADEKKSNETNFDFLPADLLCPLCQSVIEGYKKQVKSNPNFQKELLSSCEKLSEDSKDQLLICQDKITEISVKTLQEMSTKDICLDQKLCSSEDEITAIVFENPVPENMTIEAIPPIPNVTPKKSKPLLSTSAASLPAGLHVLLVVAAWNALSTLIN